MKLLSITIYRYNQIPEPIQLAQVFELSSFGFFQRSTVREMITFFTKTIAKRTPLGQRISVAQNEYMIHSYMRADGLSCTMACDNEYPSRVAFTLMTKLLDDFVTQYPNWTSAPENLNNPWSQLDQLILKYQDPAEADPIMKIQKNLDDTKAVLHETIDTVLQMGEKLETLVERSGELSYQSKLFYKESAKANACCSVL